MTSSSVLAVFAVLAASLVPATALAGHIRDTVTVTAYVAESCSVSWNDGAPTTARAATFRTSCASGRSASVAAIGQDGSVATATVGAPTRVTTEVARTSSHGTTPAEMVVTLSF